MTQSIPSPGSTRRPPHPAGRARRAPHSAARGACPPRGAPHHRHPRRVRHRPAVGNPARRDRAQQDEGPLVREEERQARASLATAAVFALFLLGWSLHTVEVLLALVLPAWAASLIVVGISS